MLEFYVLAFSLTASTACCAFSTEPCDLPVWKSQRCSIDVGLGRHAVARIHAERAAAQEALDALTERHASLSDEVNELRAAAAASMVEPLSAHLFRRFVTHTGGLPCRTVGRGQRAAADASHVTNSCPHAFSKLLSVFTPCLCYFCRWTDASHQQLSKHNNLEFDWNDSCRRCARPATLTRRCWRPSRSTR